MNGLSAVHIELTSRCNKSCWCCGRRKIEKDHPELADWGDMPMSLVEQIALQLPAGITVQLHNNGEPLLYPRFGEAVDLFSRQITSIDTNGKLLLEKLSEVILKLNTLAISVIQDDPEADEQYEIIRQFLRLKGGWPPLVVLRLNGRVDRKRYEEFGVPIASRVLHSPMGSYDYARTPTVPEVGICQEILHRLSIDRHGHVSICVRFDPEGKGILGNLHMDTLRDIWNGSKRKQWIKQHLLGMRQNMPLCEHCEFWGLPTSW